MSGQNLETVVNLEEKTHERLVIKDYVRYLFFLVFIIFVLNKLYLRPWILERDFSSFMVIIVNSLPNFVEAIMGTIVLTGLGLHLKRRYHKRLGRFKDSSLYFTATLIAGCYVISQELKFHNFGGNNTYDPYDILASVFGLLFVNVVMNRYGIHDERKIRGEQDAAT